MDIIGKGIEVFENEITALRKVQQALGEDFETLVRMLVQCTGKVVVTGMGKSGHIGSKIAATLSSLGSSAFFLHAAEALHGDLGMIQSDDIVLAISKSGETDEVTRIINNIRMIGAKVVGITGNRDSTLAKYSDFVYVFPEIEEACKMNLAPTSSTTVALVLGDALAICASEEYGFREENFALFHPSGSLGKKLLIKVEDIMKVEDENALIPVGSSLKDAIMEMSYKTLGIVNITNSENQLLGVFTDGDLKRAMLKEVDIYNTIIDDIMIEGPTTVTPSMMAVEALEIMNSRNISALPVVESGRLLGTIRINDIIREGIYV